MIQFLLAEESDAEILRDIQIQSFSIDVDICGDGPPGFDSIALQLKSIREYIYYKIISDSLIIGGFYILNLGYGKYELIRLFISPQYQHKGIGGLALQFIETLFEDIRIIELEAADFREDNHLFYTNRGYVKIGEKKYEENSFSYIFQKVIKE